MVKDTQTSTHEHKAASCRQLVWPTRNLQLSLASFEQPGQHFRCGNFAPLLLVSASLASLLCWTAANHQRDSISS